VRIVETFEEVRKASSGITGLVPTMGYLHEGHLSHLAAARNETDTVVVSLFVNPLQFNEQHDLDRYPRDLVRDRRLVAEAGADLLGAEHPAHARALQNHARPKPDRNMRSS